MYFFNLGKGLGPLSYYLNHFQNEKLMERFKNLNQPPILTLSRYDGMREMFIERQRERESEKAVDKVVVVGRGACKITKVVI